MLGKGYGKSVDYWALGILIYEMLCGHSPFYDAAGDGDQMTICRNILHAPLKFPSGFTLRSSKKIMAKRAITTYQNALKKNEA